MTTPHAFSFLLVGLGMIAGPAVWPEFFTAEQGQSALWLELMGAMQAVGGAWFLGLEGIVLFRRLAAWDPLDFHFELPDVRWAVPPSLYSVLDDSEEVVVALRLQQQLRQVAA